MNTDTLELNDDKEKQAMLAVMKEISHSMHEAEVAREQIKEIIDAASKTFDIPKALIRKVSRFYHKKNFGVFKNEANDIENLYSQLTA